MTPRPRAARGSADPWDRRNLRAELTPERAALVQIPGRAEPDSVQVLRTLANLGALLVDFGTDSPHAVRWVPGSWEVAP